MTIPTHRSEECESDPCELLLRPTEDERCNEEPQPQIEQSDQIISLPWVLHALFGLNGFTLSFQTLSLMYVVNTRVAIPLRYLPTYGAIAFLPYSLKPIYGFLSQGLPRDKLFVVLLTANSLSLFGTSAIPSGGVFFVFVAAVFRNITDSWAELCLGLTLIDHARKQQHSNYDTLASRFQSQAATARNFGSLLASLITFLMFVERRLVTPDKTQLSGAVADALLITTGCLQITGAAIAHIYRNDFCPIPSHSPFTSLRQEAVLLDEESALRDDEASHPSYSNGQEEDQCDVDSLDTSSAASGTSIGQRPYHRRANWRLMVLLQLFIIAVAMKGPIIDLTSQVSWKLLLACLLLTIIIVAVAMFLNDRWEKSHRVGLFLILRRACPSDQMIIASFLYFLFEPTPLLLQLLTLLGISMTTLSSWSYGKLWSKFSTGRDFLVVIGGTTILAALASLGNMAVFKYSSSHYIFLVALAAKAIATFFSEWAFLPDVVLATTSLSLGGNECDEQVVLHRNPPQANAPQIENEASKKIAIEYGTLLSCIDLGDQLGSLLTGPIVAVLGISRENGFHNLDSLILLCSLGSVLSIGFLLIFRNKS